MKDKENEMFDKVIAKPLSIKQIKRVAGLYRERADMLEALAEGMKSMPNRLALFYAQTLFNILFKDSDFKDSDIE